MTVCYTHPQLWQKKQRSNTGKVRVSKRQESIEAVQAWLAGDGQAFRIVYDQYVGLVQFVVDRCGLPPEDRDEIVQEAFLRLHRKADSIREAEKVKSWLAITARNLTMDRLRRSGRQKTTPVGEQTEILDVPSRPDGREEQARELELQVLSELIDKIAATPGGESFRLFYVEGWSNKQIAEHYGEAISTVTTRLSRLRARFKEELRGRIEAMRENTL